MTGGPYQVGQVVEVAFNLNSTATTSPISAIVSLVVTDPSGEDLAFGPNELVSLIPSSDSTKMHAAKFTKLFEVTGVGRWKYQFRSTGIIVASGGGAFSVRRLFASTST